MHPVVNSRPQSRMGFSLMGVSLGVVDADELAEHSLGMDPAECVHQHGELARIIAHDGQLRMC